MKNRYISGSITVVLFALMVGVAVALWEGIIPIEWLASLGYTGLFFLSLVNGVAPVAGPSQIATFFVASRLDPLLVGLSSGIGGAIGELAGYAFGYFFRAAQTPAVEAKIQRIANWKYLRISRERSFIPLFLLAAIPNPFFDPASAMAGTLRIGFLKYFVPVLLGKTVRHLAIAYSGYYALSLDVPTILRDPSMITFIDTGGLVAAVLLIALFAWIVRTYAESDPDPFLLNLTFFAFAGQCIRTSELIGERHPWMGWIVGLATFAALLVMAQSAVIRFQAKRTREHYKVILKANLQVKLSPAEIDSWADVLVRITGVDFFPGSFYKWLSKRIGSAPREDRRQKAVSILPDIFFKEVASESLVIPEESRRFLWNLYAIICFVSWIAFIVCLLIPRTL